MIRHLSLALVLLGIWLLLSGHYGPLLIGLGVTSVVLTVWIASRLNVIDTEGHPIHIALRAFTYFPWLFWEIIKSNVDVARRVLSPSLPISPQVFSVPTSQKTPVGQTIYANSITLTPGTVTIDVRGSQLDVHALTTESADGVKTGRMDARVTRFEGES